MKIIAYYRVSTQKQVTSLDVQQETVATFANRQSATVLEEYREVESGRNVDRPQLAKALDHAKYAGAKLVVAKLDRLARDVSFTSHLMDTGVDFVICDFPEANRLMVHILSALAEYEAKLIRDRTRTVLQYLKSQGVKLGSHREGHWEGREHLRLAGATKGSLESARIRSEKSADYLAFFGPKVLELKRQGLSHREVANQLNTDGFTRPRGGDFTKGEVSRLLKGENEDGFCEVQEIL